MASWWPDSTSAFLYGVSLLDSPDACICWRRAPTSSWLLSSHGARMPPFRLVVRLPAGRVTVTSSGSPSLAPGGMTADTSTSDVLLPGSSSSSRGLPRRLRMVPSSCARRPSGGGLLPVPRSSVTSPTPETTTDSVLPTTVFWPTVANRPASPASSAAWPRGVCGGRGGGGGAAGGLAGQTPGRGGQTDEGAGGQGAYRVHDVPPKTAAPNPPGVA